MNTFLTFGPWTFEHVKNDHKCMTELYRVMKKGGWGIFQVPRDYNSDTTYEDSTITDPKEREIHFWQKDHLRLYGKDYPKISNYPNTKQMVHQGWISQQKLKTR